MSLGARAGWVGTQTAARVARVVVAHSDDVVFAPRAPRASGCATKVFREMSAHCARFRAKLFHIYKNVHYHFAVGRGLLFCKVGDARDTANQTAPMHWQLAAYVGVATGGKEHAGTQARRP